MPKDGHHRFTAKEHRQAMHIKASYMKKGMSEEEAEELAWKTVSKSSLSDLRRGGKGKHH